MEPTVIYTEVNLPGSSLARRNTDSFQQADRQFCPRWHQIVLHVGWAGNILLVVTVIVMAVWAVNKNHHEKHAAATAATLSSNQVSEGSNTLEEFKFFLKQNLCEVGMTSRENRICDLCPVEWLLHKHKCYWFSTSIQSWEKSKEDCVTKKSQLAVIHDQQEKEFFQSKQEGRKTWLGLQVTLSEKKWVWVNGSPLNQTLFPASVSEKGSCGAVGKNGFSSELCSTDLHWICQKDSVLV